MGGYGSGQRYGYVKRLVEDGYTFSISTIQENVKVIDLNGGKHFGSISCSIGGERKANMIYVIQKEDILEVEVSYTITDKLTQDRKVIEYPIRIETTNPNFGGKRYWFLCPLIVDGNPCLNHVGKLYLPPGSQYFGCRKCHDLTYTSCRESHKWDSMFRGMGMDPSVQKWLYK
ncbi:MAG: hypothetical protein HN921_09020 [Bacteroidetes bacterium]|nr:hypothetical protein [Bacteroidota bacterium]